MRHQFNKLVANKFILLTLSDKQTPYKTKQKIVKTLEKESINQILEILTNTLNGNIPLEKTKKQKLSKYKTVLRTLVSKKNYNLKKKKKLISGVLKVIVSILHNFFTSPVWDFIQNVK